MAKRRRFAPEFKAQVVIEALSGEVHKQNCVGDITSAQTNFQSESGYSLRTQRPCLDRGIILPLRTLRNTYSSFE